MSQNNQTAKTQSPEETAIARCDTRIKELQQSHPDWFELFDDTLPDNAPRSEVVELMLSAPNDFSMGLMYGKYTMRLEIAAVTGRDFE